MDNNEITPIFQDDDQPTGPPPPPPLAAREQPEVDRGAELPQQIDHHQTPINQVMEPQPSFYQPPPYYPEPAQGPPGQPKWDPFSTIGVTSWVVIAIAFIIGFVVGKLR